MQSISMVTQDELMLATIDGKLSKCELPLQLRSAPLNLRTSFLGGAALSRDMDVPVGMGHKLYLARASLLRWWLSGPRIIAWHSYLSLGTLLDLIQVCIVGTGNEWEKLRRDIFQAQIDIGCPFLDDCLYLPARHLSCNGIAFNQDVNRDTVVVVLANTRLLSSGNLHPCASSLLNVLDDRTLAADNVRSSRRWDGDANRLLRRSAHGYKKHMYQSKNHTFDPTCCATSFKACLTASTEPLPSKMIEPPGPPRISTLAFDFLLMSLRMSRSGFFS